MISLATNWGRCTSAKIEGATWLGLVCLPARKVAVISSSEAACTASGVGYACKNRSVERCCNLVNSFKATG